VDAEAGGADAHRRTLPAAETDEADAGQLRDFLREPRFGKVFDLRLPLEQVAEGYRAMDERRAIKTLLCP